MKAYLSITQDFLVNFTEWFYNVLIRISIIFRKWRERWQENYIYVQHRSAILRISPTGCFAAYQLADKLREGKNIALITDAGTPGISDPGEDLVRICYEEGIEVTSLPGAAACITALTMSGLPTRRFAFEAFLPREKKERAAILQELKDETRTIIIYEAPHHLVKTLEELYDTLGDRQISICRELTKRYEEKMRTTLSDSLVYYGENEPRGEYVLVIHGKTFEELAEEARKSWEDMSLEEHMQVYESQGTPRKEAMKLVAKDRGMSKRDVYQALLKEE